MKTLPSNLAAPDRHSPSQFDDLPAPAASRWDRHLPDAWIDAVDQPLHFDHYSEYEIKAERTVGYDADYLPCFTSHSFTLPRPATDDPGGAFAYSEEMAAWRLRDERWLIFRTITTQPCNPPRGFYAISPDMPR